MFGAKLEYPLGDRYSSNALEAEAWVVVFSHESSHARAMQSPHLELTLHRCDVDRQRKLSPRGSYSSGGFGTSTRKTISYSLEHDNGCVTLKVVEKAAKGQQQRRAEISASENDPVR